MRCFEIDHKLCRYDSIDLSMTTQIHDDQSLSEIREIFERNYPHLAIDFFERDMHGLVTTVSGRPSVCLNSLLGEFRIDKTDEGIFDLAGQVRIKDIGAYFDSNYCLHVQLYQQINGRWILLDPNSKATLQECSLQTDTMPH